MMKYVAILHKDSDSDYGVSFPDFLGCVTAAKSIHEAEILAKEALELHVEGLLADGMTLPQPTPIDEVQTRGGNTFWVELNCKTQL